MKFGVIVSAASDVCGGGHVDWESDRAVPTEFDAGGDMVRVSTFLSVFEALEIDNRVTVV